jgi:23S rRNA (cytidine1920-2'-O)/16S rRNA (cytidine1409-2'-O)-methyltransferase
LKLDFALDHFGLDVSGLIAADFGCNVGGFTDCLLHRGAAKVYAIDTGYGMLDYNLRRDERVIVMERTNVLFCDPPAGGVDFVVIDAGWTPQSRVLPIARQWLTPSIKSAIVTLIKPHYENTSVRRRRGPGRPTILDENKARAVLDSTLKSLVEQSFVAGGVVQSPIVGGKGKGRRGNIEFLALFRP